MILEEELHTARQQLDSLRTESRMAQRLLARAVGSALAAGCGAFSQADAAPAAATSSAPIQPRPGAATAPAPPQPRRRGPTAKPGEQRYTRSQVAAADGADARPMWISYRDGVYDVTQFAKGKLVSVCRRSSWTVGQ